MIRAIFHPAAEAGRIRILAVMPFGANPIVGDGGYDRF